jgi:hypothetical protein
MSGSKSISARRYVKPSRERDFEMGQFRVQISPLWLSTAIVVFGLNLAGVVAALEPKSSWIPGARGTGRPNILIRQMYDGSVVKYICPLLGSRSGPFVIQPASALGLCQVWWPVAASISASLLILAISWLRSRRRIEKSLRRPRLTMLQSMVLVGLISFWLWLIRFDVSLIVVGFIVLALMLHAAYRRSKLVDETKAAIISAPTLSRLGIAGYSIAVLLALAWMISILVWDSYQGVRP